MCSVSTSLVVTQVLKVKFRGSSLLSQTQEAECSVQQHKTAFRY